MKNPITYLLMLLIAASALTIAEAKVLKPNAYPICEPSRVDGFCTTPPGLS